MFVLFVTQDAEITARNILECNKMNHTLIAGKEEDKEEQNHTINT